MVAQIGVTEFGDLNSQNGITKSVFRFLHENGVPKFGDPKNGVPKTVFRNRCFRFFPETVVPQMGVPVFRNYPVSYARFYQPMPASRTYVGEVNVQLLTTIVSPNQVTSTLSEQQCIEASTLVSAF